MLLFENWVTFRLVSPLLIWLKIFLLIKAIDILRLFACDFLG